MARTVETIIQIQLGQLTMQNAILIAENEALKEQLAALRVPDPHVQNEKVPA